MDEVFPILAGIVLGLAFAGRLRRPWPALAFALLATFLAFVASTISGEIAVSWSFVGIDLIETLAAGLFAAAAASRLRRTASSPVR
jgi:hypothetical protein